MEARGRRFCFPLPSGAGGHRWPSHISRQFPAEDSIQIRANDGGTKPVSTRSREMLRFVSFASHSIPLACTRAEGVAKRFSEGVSGA
jgi:hypothetical protein